jgi:hypothetical protein
MNQTDIELAVEAVIRRRLPDLRGPCGTPGPPGRDGAPGPMISKEQVTEFIKEALLDVLSGAQVWEDRVREIIRDELAQATSRKE